MSTFVYNMSLFCRYVEGNSPFQGCILVLFHKRDKEVSTTVTPPLKKEHIRFSSQIIASDDKTSYCYVDVWLLLSKISPLKFFTLITQRL